jgi:hypothetical protein
LLIVANSAIASSRKLRAKNTLDKLASSGKAQTGGAPAIRDPRGRA